MSRLEAQEFPQFSQERRREASFLQKEFGLVKVNPRKERGVPGLAYISEFDGWAIERESFLGRWLEFTPVKRLKGIAQLGLNRELPLPNYHTRFDHSAEVALRTALVLSRLARDFRREFLAISQGYSLNLNPKLSGKKREDQQILKTIKLGAIYAANHDIATPAGGDAIKYIVGLDDDRDLPEVLNWNSAEFTQLCQKSGFDPREAVSLFTQLAQRKEEGILGQLIHCSGGEDRGFDLDSICYTLMDAQNSLGLSWEGPPLPQQIIEEELQATADDLKEQQKELNRQARNFVDSHWRSLRDAYLHDLSLNLDFPVVFKIRKPALALGDFAPFSSLALKEGRVVFTDPHKLDSLWLLQNFLVENLYFSPAALGPEIGLADMVLSEQTRPPSESGKRYLLTVDDQRLGENLRRRSPNLAYWFSNLAALGWEGENLGRGSQPRVFLPGISARDTRMVDNYALNLLRIRKMPTRLETPVLVFGEIRNFGEIFSKRKEEIERRKGLPTWLTDSFPRTSRPIVWVWADEDFRPERHRWERQPYW